MNETTQQRSKSKWRWIHYIANLLVCVIVIGLAIAAVIWINRTEPVAEKVNTTRKSAALVETTTVRRGTYTPRLVVLGTVQAAQQISLRPRVSGQVIELSPEFVPGGMIKKGALLLRIDPADFQAALSISQSELAQAEASMEIEMARQRLAEKELKLLEGSIDETNRGLVMREPQIASIKAEVSAAKAAVCRSKLDLERADIFAPFDAQILTRSSNVGSQVGPGDELGQLIGQNEYWVMATVPVRSLRWVQFPIVKQPMEAPSGPTKPLETPDATNDKAASEEKAQEIVASPGSKVILRNPDAWGQDIKREARVSKLIGTLDQQTRLARVLITVDDPLGQQSKMPPLILESLVETEIEGRPIENVVRIERAYIRDRDTVWVMKNKKLEIRETEITFQDAKYAYIRKGLDDGDQIVTSTLATVAEGIGLRTTNETQVELEVESEEPSSDDATEGVTTKNEAGQ